LQDGFKSKPRKPKIRKKMYLIQFNNKLFQKHFFFNHLSFKPPRFQRLL